MTNGNFNPGVDDPNKPPTLTVASTVSAKVGAPVTLTVAASDDGLPKPRQAPAPKPAETKTAGNPFAVAQVNSSAPPRPRGLSVSWMQYRGPAKVFFEPATRHSGSRRTEATPRPSRGLRSPAPTRSLRAPPTAR